MRFRFLSHFFYFLFGKLLRRDNLYALLLAGSQVLCFRVDNAIRVNVKRNLDLRNAARRRRNADKLESSKSLVIIRHLPFALHDMNVNCRLVVCCSAEHLALLGRNGCIALNQFCENPSKGFNAQRQRRNVQQKHVLDFA